MEYIPFKKMMKLKKYLEKHRIPYRSETCNESITLISKMGTFTNRESRFPSKELWFIAAIKDYILKNKLYKRFKNNFRRKGSQKKIKYFYFNKKVTVGTVFEDCYEIDMKSAYFETAYMMKPSLIPQHLYERALYPNAPHKPISKRTRLASLGSLARKRKIAEFDGRVQHKLPPERETKTEFLWDTICHRVGRLMYKMSRQAGDDFIFFWVDALFVKKASLNKVKALMDAAGYKYSIFKVKKITFDHNQILVDGKVKRVKDKATKKWINKTERPFPYRAALSEQEMLNLANQSE